jgi:DNA repair protein RAD50
MKALDCAIMEYHSEKMAEINSILRELWTEVRQRMPTHCYRLFCLQVYKQGDIDYIEIKTEGTADGKSSGGRRTYNYRVVMVCNGHEIDMRGRCSAGQKVCCIL